MTVSVLGVTETIAAFAKAAVAGKAAAEESKKALSEEVATIARTEHPWQNVTGETEASIQATEVGVVSGGASIFLEFGTSKMAARPFMRPAADSASGTTATQAAVEVMNGLA